MFYICTDQLENFPIEYRQEQTNRSNSFDYLACVVLQCRSVNEYTFTNQFL
jgi:hypothetical protein